MAAFQFASRGLHVAPVAGVALCAAVAMWAAVRTYHLLGIALVLESVEQLQATLAARGVVVSREKALEISAALCEAQRVAREAKTKQP